MVAVALNLQIFRSDRVRGITLALLMLFYGLSSTIYAQIYRFGYSNATRVDTSGFLFFMFISVTFVNILGVLFLEKVPLSPLPAADDHPEQLMMEKPIQIDEVDITDASTTTHQSPLTRTSTSNRSDVKTDCESSVLATQVATPVDEKIDLEKQPIKEQEENVFKAILSSSTFWAYIIVLIWQQGLTYMSNVSLIIRSTAPMDKVGDDVYLAQESSVHTTLQSVFQSIGRFVFAYISQHTSTFILLDNTVLMTIMEFLLLVPLLILTISPMATNADLIASSVMVGLGWGACAGLYPGLVRDYFGMKNYGTASGLVMVAVPIGIYVSNHIFGMSYDSARVYQPIPVTDPPVDSSVCVGPRCYKDAMFIFLWIQLVPIVASIFLVWQRVYLPWKRKKETS